MKNNFIKLLWILLSVIPILLLILGYIYPSSFFSNQETIRNFVDGYGIFAPIIFIILQILQVILTPINHYVLAIAGGYIFGSILGGIYNWIGRVIGTYIAFWLGRKFGRKIIVKFVKKTTLKKYDNIFKKGHILLFLMYFLPLFPDDEISYLAGFSSINSKAFYIIMLLGHIGGSFGLSYLGSGVSKKDPIFISFVILSIIGFVIFSYYYKKTKFIE